jgi:hypothetical protein
MTEAELKYLDVVKRLVKNNRGEIESERSHLNWHRDRLGLSVQEAEAIEQRVLSAYQKFLSQSSLSQSSGSSRSITDTSTIGKSHPPAASMPDPNYAVKLERYRNVFAQALDANQLADEATQDRLWQLQRELRLDGQDVAQAEQQVLADRSKNTQSATNSRVYDYSSPTQPPSFTSASSSLPPTEIQSPQPPSSLSIAHLPEGYSELQQHLANGAWRDADRATLNLLLILTDRAKEGWLDVKAIEAMTCEHLNRIDQLWNQHSGGHFGFRVQGEIYFQTPVSEPSFINSAQTTYLRALELSKAVGWWQRGAHFHKYYNQLRFTLDAPRGHLPALWYWRIPWWRTLQFGGLGTGRGGCRVDADLITAMMKKLQECDKLL